MTQVCDGHPGLRTVRESRPARAAAEPLDLLFKFDQLALMLDDALDSASMNDVAAPEHVADAYLATTGMSQIVEDFAHRSWARFGGADRRRRSNVLMSLVFVVYGAIATLCTVVRRRRAARWHADLHVVIDGLAAALLDQLSGRGAPLLPSEETVHALRAGTARLPRRVRRDVARLPDCFRSFDQRPEDCRLFATAFSERWPQRDVPVLVVGIRTSGSYLAPLQAHALRELGYSDVEWTTYRTGQASFGDGVGTADRIREGTGVVIVVDDPPVTGSKLAETANHLEQAGLPRQSIVLFVPLFGSDEDVPAPLRRWPLVLLPWKRWSFHDLLQPEAVAHALTELWCGPGARAPVAGESRPVISVDAVVPLDLAPIADVLGRPIVRSHRRALYGVRVSVAGGAQVSVDVYVKGTGFGYFGRHSMALARRLGDLVPVTYGWRDGVVFREAVTAPGGSSGSDIEAFAPAIAAYVARRAAAAAVLDDPSSRLRNRRTVYQLSADQLMGRLGRFTPVGAPLARSAAKELVGSATIPSVVDGNAIPCHWYRNGSGRLVKVDFDERAFSVWDHACYDPVWDLAAASAHEVMEGFLRNDAAHTLDLRREYERLTGSGVDPERWLLYRTLRLNMELGHLMRLVRDGEHALQAAHGGPAMTPPADEERFSAGLAPAAWACRRSLDRVWDQYLAEVVLADAQPSGGGPLVAVHSDCLTRPPGNERMRLTYAAARALRALLRHGYRVQLVTESSAADLRRMCEDYGVAGGVTGRGTAVVSTSGNACIVRVVQEKEQGGPAPPRSETVDPGPGPVPAGGDHADPLPVGHGDRHEELVRDLCAPPRAGTVSGLGDIWALVGHGPRGCGVCRAPRLSPRARLVVTALDDGPSGVRRLAPLAASWCRLTASRRVGRRVVSGA